MYLAGNTLSNSLRAGFSQLAIQPEHEQRPPARRE
jgi:hypothetical protein